MFITLIGMSGIGKSYWSKKLEQHDFIRFGCDDLITEYLAKKLGFANAMEFDMHAWVGYPDETTHAERAKEYLQAEETVLMNIINNLEAANHQQNFVIDSTGSIIYMKSNVISRLKELTHFVYLDIAPDDLDKMFTYYMQNPVAIMWNGYFQAKPDEPRLKTFERCYPLLIQSREQKYQEIAQITVPPEVHRAQETTVEKILGYIKSKK